jgi:hypothetical protein
MGRYSYYSVGSGQSYSGNNENAAWRLNSITVDKYMADPLNGGVPLHAKPVETVKLEGNMLMNAGAGAMWALFTGASGAASVTPYDGDNAHLGVGDSIEPTDRTQTDLQASVNKFRQQVDPGYPLHDNSGSAATTVVYRSTFGAGDANFSWNEWGLFNSDTGGVMANRKVESLGTKTSAGAWVLTIVISLS